MRFLVGQCGDQAPVESGYFFGIVEMMASIGEQGTAFLQNAAHVGLF